MPASGAAPGKDVTLDPRRVVGLEGATNFRDLGGYRAVDGRTIRWGIVCLTIGFSVWLLSPVAEKVLVKPHWLTLALAIVGLLAAPSSLFKVRIGLLHRNIKRLSKRAADREKQSDPERTSSGLKSDGTSPFGH